LRRSWRPGPAVHAGAETGMGAASLGGYLSGRRARDVRRASWWLLRDADRCSYSASRVYGSDVYHLSRLFVSSCSFLTDRQGRIPHRSVFTILSFPAEKKDRFTTLEPRHLQRVLCSPPEVECSIAICLQLQSVCFKPSFYAVKACALAICQ
jgi:hypothetical protein